jgi:hypothetical protein
LFDPIVLGDQANPKLDRRLTLNEPSGRDRLFSWVVPEQYEDLQAVS